MSWRPSSRVTCDYTSRPPQASSPETANGDRVRGVAPAVLPALNAHGTFAGGETPSFRPVPWAGAVRSGRGTIVGVVEESRLATVTWCGRATSCDRLTRRTDCTPNGYPWHGARRIRRLPARRQDLSPRGPHRGPGCLDVHTSYSRPLPRPSWPRLHGWPASRAAAFRQPGARLPAGCEAPWGCARRGRGRRIPVLDAVPRVSLGEMLCYSTWARDDRRGAAGDDTRR